MNENIANDGDLDEPGTLSEYLKSKLPASKYLKLLEEVLGAPGEAERKVAVELCVAEPALISKAVDLSRLASDRKIDSRIRNAIRTWSCEIIRSIDSDLQDWRRVGTVSPEGELSLLAMRLRRIRKTGEREDEASAEQVLRLGLIVTATHPDFDIVTSLETIYKCLHPDSPDQGKLRRSMSDMALRASPKLLENLADLTRLVRFENDPLRREVADLQQKLQSIRDSNFSLQRKSESLEEQVEKLKVENDELAKKLSLAESKISGVLGGADQDKIQLRARYRNLLKRKLEPNLEDAREGLEHDPPNVDFANHRIKLAEREIGKELEWLSQSSD